jgi:hypothetical protein
VMSDSKNQIRATVQKGQPHTLHQFHASSQCHTSPPNTSSMTPINAKDVTSNLKI